jgi:hypothetical protein
MRLYVAVVALDNVEGFLATQRIGKDGIKAKGNSIAINKGNIGLASI